MDRLSRVPRVLLFGVVAVYLLLPLTAITLYSFATSWTAHALPDGYTLSHWQAAFTNTRLLLALGRTFLLALSVLLLDIALVVPAVSGSGSATPGFASLSSWRRRSRLSCRSSSSPLASSVCTALSRRRRSAPPGCSYWGRRPSRSRFSTGRSMERWPPSASSS